MPEMMTVPVHTFDGMQLEPHSVEVATEAELLEFANKVRAAGGANILDALLPSEPSDPRACLIANALNFSCEVRSIGSWPDGVRETYWGMYFPYNMSNADRSRISEATGCPIDNFYAALKLPRHIGNAAAAFDAGVAFNNYRKFGF